MTNGLRRGPPGVGVELECPRIVIADDHVPTRTGVRMALEEEGFIVCAEEATAAGAVAAALRDPPDLCLLDVDMPGGGIEAAETIRAALPQTQIVMLSESAADDALFAALRAGASGYLLTGVNPSRLGAALRDVLNGGAALSREFTARLIAEFRAQARRGPTSLTRPTEHDLTRREWEVLDCLRDGLSTHRIAKHLFISETTVRRHIGSILKKLDVPTREAAVKATSQRSRNLNDE
jgi:two-component system, NarL family, nitrate/nitrite response regulator NarL